MFWIITGSLVVVLLAAGGVLAFLLWPKNNQQDNADTSAATDTPLSLQSDTTATPAPEFPKNYGNKYANGILPVGDNKYTTDSAKKGYIYLCSANFIAGGGGAQKRGPWFVNNNTQWDVNKKVTVRGSVSWQPSMSEKVEDGKRIITTNGLPNHKTGIFPIALSDPAHAYDANPNKIASQAFTYTVAASPTAGQPQCMHGEAGIMLTGVPLFNAFDAGGRDAGAWEVQDDCDGHPQVTGEYHYHTLSRCITDQSVETVLGFALDGFPITGPKVGDNNILTTDDLDECHGFTSTINFGNQRVKTYHYVMTQDFPYSVSCFRATPASLPNQPTGAKPRLP
jgi:hypothetical protein